MEDNTYAHNYQETPVKTDNRIKYVYLDPVENLPLNMLEPLERSIHIFSVIDFDLDSEGGTRCL